MKNVWFWINCENISNQAFLLVKLNGLKEEGYFNESAPEDTKLCLEVSFWSHGSLVGLYFLDPENETFFNITSMMNLEKGFILSAFMKILKAVW